jgi:hypothetical protein
LSWAWQRDQLRDRLPQLFWNNTCGG